MPRILSTNRGEVLIRRAVPSDSAAYRELRLEALKNHPTAFGADYEENLAHPPEYWEQRLKINDEKEVLFLAEHREKLVGMTGIFRSLSARSRHAGTVWGVYVRAGWRGSHIAEELIHECLEWAQQKGMVIARLGVAADNKPAIRCYERCGFTVYGTEAKSLYYQGRYVDEYLMHRSLEGG